MYIIVLFSYLHSVLGEGVQPLQTLSLMLRQRVSLRSVGKRVPGRVRRPRLWQKVLRCSIPSSRKKQWPKVSQPIVSLTFPEMEHKTKIEKKKQNKRAWTRDFQTTLTITAIAMLRYNQRYLFCIRATSSFTHFKQAYKIFLCPSSLSLQKFFLLVVFILLCFAM